MARVFSTSQPDFEVIFEEMLNAKRDSDDDVDRDVAEILADVQARGDAALIEKTRKWDRFDLTADTIRISTDEIDTACAKVEPDDRSALGLAASRIRAYHERQLPQSAEWEDPTGAILGWRWTAVDSTGIYVPGGLASYPSSVLMNVIPAQVAGVGRISMCVPTPRGVINPMVLYAARLAGIETIYRIGGAQAIGALAYGTKSVAAVDNITGPGNAFVAAAKRQVFGRVGIDMIAGPSEVLVIADRSTDPEWLALDLLAQAEHDKSAQSILITDDVDFAEKVIEAVSRRLETLERREIAAASWRDFGAVIIVKSWKEAVDIANRIAPEHLELCVEEPDFLLNGIRHAGAIFVGALTPEAVGDYVGGPNHVLPTSRTARYSSGLSVLDFMKRTTISRMTPASLKEIGPAAARLAKSEGLEAHGLSVKVRLQRLNESSGHGSDD